MRLDFVKLQKTAIARNAPTHKKTKPSTVQSETTPNVVGDRAELSTSERRTQASSKPGFAKRLAAKARKLALYGMIGIMGLNAIGPSIAQTAERAWADNNQTEIMAVNDNLSSDQSRLARAEMAELGNGAVAYLADQGVKLHIVDNDAESAEVLTEHMNYPKVSTQQLEFVGKKAQQVGDWLDSQTTIQTLGSRIDSLQVEQRQEHANWRKSVQDKAPQQQQAPGGRGLMGGMGGIMTGMGGGGGASESSPMVNLGGMMGQMRQQSLPSSLLEANANLSDARVMLHSQVAGELDKAALSEQVRPAISGGPSISVDMAVRMSGAKTPAEKAEFRNLIYEWNGDRIQNAQSDGLQQMEENLSHVQNPEARKFFSSHLEAAKENPDLIQMNTSKGSLLLPNFSYHHFEGQDEGQSFRIPIKESSNLSTYVQGSSGLYNNYSRHSQVDDHALQPEYGSKVVVHELAHALDGVMEQENPDFHKQWHTRVKVAYESAEHNHSHGHEVNSEYGMTNYKEYVAEGVERLISDPGHLQETDPALFQLSQELLKEANKLGNSSFGGAVREAALGQLGGLYTRPEENRTARPFLQNPPTAGS